MAARGRPAPAADRHRGAARHRSRVSPSWRGRAARHRRPPARWSSATSPAARRRRGARRALIDHELERFTRWLETLEVLPTIAALRERAAGDRAAGAARERATAGRRLTDADRERLELLAAAIAKRLLQQPILRLRLARDDEHATYAYIQALRELFGLEREQSSAFGLRARRAERPPGGAGAIASHAAPPRAGPAASGAPERAVTASDPHRHAGQRACARSGQTRGTQRSRQAGEAELVPIEIGRCTTSEIRGADRTSRAS